MTRYVERGRRSRTRFTQAFTSVGDTVDNAGRNAVNFCERDKGGGECELRYILCATGEDDALRRGHSRTADRERLRHLEYEHRVGVALCVERANAAGHHHCG